MKNKIYTRLAMFFTMIFLLSAGVMAQTTIEVYIVDELDDAEETVVQLANSPVGEVDRTSSDLEIPFDREPQIVGLLFRNLEIPYGSIIDEATVRFDVDAVVEGTTDQPITVQIRAALEPSIDSILDEDFGISKYSTTTASVDWSPAASVEEHEKVYTSNFATVVQEVIDQTSWASGNNMMVVIAGDPNQTEDINREFEQFDTEDDGTIRERTPMLTVTYHEGTNAISEASGKFVSSIYPNPAQGAFYIENPVADDYSYEIFNVTGQSIAKKKHLTSERILVDVTELNQGIYFVDVKNAEKTETHKLIIR
jgi:hypothetical protein